jgi:hypothetical protein
MIRDWLTYLSTHCSREARRLGYLHEAIAIRERHARNRAAWETHLTKCREFILKAVAHCEQKDCCIVLGSGLLLDVPLDSLAREFTRVHLVDIIHLPEIRRRARLLPNVHLNETDVTGLAERLADPPAGTSTDALPSPAPPDDLVPDKADLAVSLNLLSQLPLNLVSALGDNPPISANAVVAWKREIRQSHWDWVQSLAHTRCLITDEIHLAKDLAGRTTGEDQLLELTDLPTPEENWIWQLAPLGEIDGTHSTEAQVLAWMMTSPP